MKKNTWPKSITVDKRIVKILSESTYDNFPTSLKEIITNSYDADASEVHIVVNLTRETLEITDNGKGMSEKEFDFFTRIAGVKREKEGGLTPSGRHIIGKFGVGFLSIFPFFKSYSIESSKKGSEEVLTADIPSYKYFTSGQLVDVSEIPIQGGVKIDKSRLNQSFTKITLKGFTPIASNFFHPVKNSEASRYSIQSLSSIEKLKWRLEEDLPIRYEDDRFNVLTKKYSPNLQFKVFFNNELLQRRLYAHHVLEITNQRLEFNRIYKDRNLDILESDTKTLGSITFQYFILSDKSAVRPYEGRGLKIRNLNAGVGDREAFGLGTEIKGARSRLQQLTGEILVEEGLNDLISVSRDKFYFHPDYETFREFFIERLSHHSTLLEKESDYLKESESTKIKNLKYIQEDEEEPKKTPKKSKAPSKRAVVPKQEKIKKYINVGDYTYEVVVSKWDYKNEFTPACKIQDDTILINKSYPLFSGVKYTDIFIKLHILLLQNYYAKTLDNKAYKKLTNEILNYYSDYI